MRAMCNMTPARLWRLARSDNETLAEIGRSYNVKQIIPSAENWEIRVAALGFILFGVLWFFNIVASVISFCQPRQWLAHWISIHRKKREVINYIPYMTSDEREIIAYLLANNMKTFKADADGGKATTLLSRGIVITHALPNQCLDFQNVPMTIPDPFWDVLQLHKDQFPYTPPKGDKVELHPWRASLVERC
jgi:hypothetical protein